MQMDEGMDTGDMLLTTSISPSPDETTGSLFPKLAELGGTTLLKALELLKEEKLKPTKQDDSKATTAPMLKKEDGLINWSKSAAEIHCLIRGMDPWPSAYCFLDGKRFRLFSPEVLHQDSDAEPGTLIEADKRGLLFSTGSNCLLVKEVQPEGKKRMSAESFLCGSQIKSGTSFAS
jgi:methionyl-tRNA formyltransferase